ncbi:MAG: hypothetical protein IJP45_09175 [Paludibacteraceae bacterium]|nr:hypothetical protein [Paludibacteraceae bacterium]
MAETIILAVIGSGALSALIAGIFQLINNRREKTDERFRTLEKDVLRTQLMLMIADFPNEKTDILKLAQHYFEDLDGNWVLSSVFSGWLKENDIAIPEWFKGEK